MMELDALTPRVGMYAPQSAVYLVRYSAAIRTRSSITLPRPPPTFFSTIWLAGLHYSPSQLPVLFAVTWGVVANAVQV